MKKYVYVLLIISLALALSACGGEAELPVNDEVTPEIIEMGKTVFRANCSSCHSATKDSILVGPSMIGIADRAGNKLDGLDAYAYIRQSILEPAAYLNEDFPNVMPDTYSNTLTDEQLNAVIQYLLNLEN